MIEGTRVPDGCSKFSAATFYLFLFIFIYLLILKKYMSRILFLVRQLSQFLLLLFSEQVCWSKFRSQSTGVKHGYPVKHYPVKHEYEQDHTKVWYPGTST